MFHELRQYRTLPGKREEWVEYMENEIIPFQVSKGMVIAGSFVGEEEDDLYVWSGSASTRPCTSPTTGRTASAPRSPR